MTYGLGSFACICLVSSYSFLFSSDFDVLQALLLWPARTIQEDLRKMAKAYGEIRKHKGWGVFLQISWFLLLFKCFTLSCSFDVLEALVLWRARTVQEPQQKSTTKEG